MSILILLWKRKAQHIGERYPRDAGWRRSWWLLLVRVGAPYGNETRISTPVGASRRGFALFKPTNSPPFVRGQQREGTDNHDQNDRCTNHHPLVGAPGIRPHQRIPGGANYRCTMALAKPQDSARAGGHEQARVHRAGNGARHGNAAGVFCAPVRSGARTNG